MSVVNIALLFLALPATLACAYLILLTLLSGAPSVPPPSSRRLRFDVIVPAHNEEAVITRTVASLRSTNWPAELIRIWVVADNCEDSTATLAEAAGARVLVRCDNERRGKGHALDFAFNNCYALGFADAVVVVDADTEVSINLIEAFAARIERGAHAVQASYGILNPLASWRTSLITIAKASFHIVRSRARERMQLSCGIRGNCWCLTTKVLRLVPFQAYSLTEDLEYGITLGLSGYRVHYADEAHANAEMAETGAIAGSQRQRWEDGRFQLIRAKTLPLLIAAVQRRSAICLDLAIDLMVLPLSYVALNVAALSIAAFLVGRPMQNWLWIAFACVASLTIYVLRGWQLSGLGLKGLFVLARAPLFVAWKLWVMLRQRESRGWVSTQRTRAEPTNPDSEHRRQEL